MGIAKKGATKSQIGAAVNELKQCPKVSDRRKSSKNDLRLKRVGIDPEVGRQFSADLVDSDILGTELTTALLDYFCTDPAFQQRCLDGASQYRLNGKPIQNTLAAKRETVEKFQLLLKGDRFSLNKWERRNDRFFATASAAVWCYLHDPEIRAKIDNHYYHFMLNQDLAYIRKMAKKHKA